MPRMIFVNLPVDDLDRATSFYRALGFEQHADTSSDKAAAFVVSDTIWITLLTRPYFQEFINGDIAATPATTEVTIGLSAETREEADDLRRRAREAGGSAWRGSFEEGSMYVAGFLDPDGHVWEIVHAPDA